MAEKKKHPLCIHAPHELYMFLKRSAVDQHRTMTDLVISQLEKYKNKIEKRVDK